MEAIIEIIEKVLHTLAEIGVPLLELVGVVIILITAAVSLFKVIKKDHGVHVSMPAGFAQGLEFMLGAEILKVVLVKNWADLGHLAAAIAIHAALTFLLQYEVRNAKKDHH